MSFLELPLRNLSSALRQLTRARHGVIVAGPPKSAAGRRTLSVPRPLMELLAVHIVRRGLTTDEVDDYVLTLPEGGPLDYDHWRMRYWIPATKAIGLPWLTTEQARCRFSLIPLGERDVGGRCA